MARGFHRVYLGAAPGVGKTFAMLNEGVRRHARGEDVAVGWFQEHGRPETTAKLEGLEVVPARRLDYRGVHFEEMDIDALLERKPALALVDELAHTNVPGSRNEKRWQDVEELLEAGISVISTLNIQHLESINDVVERITGVRQAETIPDAVVRRADQIELVDLTPEALRRRLARGDVYAPEKIDAALANYFRPGNLGALRELALLWVADRVEESLDAYMETHDIADTWETRERVVVAISGRHNDEALLRRAARIAGRMRGELIACHVREAEGFGAGASAETLEEIHRLVIDLGGSYHEIAASDIAPALIDFARSEHATQLVLGASSRSRLTEFLRGSVINSVNRASGPIDVHIISEARGEAIPGEAEPMRRAHPAALSQRRRLQVLALVLARRPAADPADAPGPRGGRPDRDVARLSRARDPDRAARRLAPCRGRGAAGPDPARLRLHGSHGLVQGRRVQGHPGAAGLPRRRDRDRDARRPARPSHDRGRDGAARGAGARLRRRRRKR